MANPRNFDDGAFTPRQFPLDPFHYHVDPWSLDPTALPDDDVLAGQQKVVFVLGEPPLSALAPLFHSQHLASSLVILATARTYIFPSTFVPSLIVIHLKSPLSTSDQIAHRLVHILQRADSLAASWRSHPSPVQFQEFYEDATPPPPLATQYSLPKMPSAPTSNRPTSWFSNHGGSNSSSPTSSQSHIGLQTPPRSISRLSTISNHNNNNVNASNKNSRTSTIGGGSSSTSLSGLSVISMGSAPPPKPLSNDTHSFDAILNFIPPPPPGEDPAAATTMAPTTDRAMLKFAILVTTVTRPFLSTGRDSGLVTERGGAGSRRSNKNHPNTGENASKRTSLMMTFRGSRGRISSGGPPSARSSYHSSFTGQSSYNTPALTQVMHLIPPARSSLFRPLESFCLSFFYPQTHGPHANANLSPRSSVYSQFSSLNGNGSIFNQASKSASPRPYLLPPYSLSELLPLQGPLDQPSASKAWTLFDIILSGLLDSPAPPRSHRDYQDPNYPIDGSFEMSAAVMMGTMGRKAHLNGVGDIVVRDPVMAAASIARPSPAVVGSTGMSRRAYEKSTMRGEKNTNVLPGHFSSLDSDSGSSSGARGWRDPNWLGDNGLTQTGTDKRVRESNGTAYPTPPTSEGSSPSVSPAPESEAREKERESLRTRGHEGERDRVKEQTSRSRAASDKVNGDANGIAHRFPLTPPSTDSSSSSGDDGRETTSGTTITPTGTIRITRGGIKPLPSISSSSHSSSGSGHPTSSKDFHSGSVSAASSGPAGQNVDHESGKKKKGLFKWMKTRSSVSVVSTGKQ